MQTLEELKEEELLNKKIRQKRRIRGVLIIVNALLIAYAGFLSVTSIVDAIKNNQEKEQGDIITLLDKSPNKSMELYNEYITDKKDIVDVAIYGNYLLFSSSRVTPTSFVKEGSVTLFKVVDNNPSFNEPNLVYTLNSNINSQIDLFSLEQGDYLIYSNFDVTTPNVRVAYHYTGSKMFEETIYSLPLEDGSRTKITVKGKDSSPALVISVSKVSACPESYYDFVVLNESTNENQQNGWINDLSKNYKVKEVNYLVEAYKTDASYALNVIDGEEVYASKFLGSDHSSAESIEKGPLLGLDVNNAIRELGGYLFNAGYGVSLEDSNESISHASIEIKNHLESTHKGKMTLVVGNQFSNIREIVDEIFELK
jgi:hypothetical protein